MSTRMCGIRPIGTGQVVGCEGAIEEQNRRVRNEIADEQFTRALREYELALANRIEAEIYRMPPVKVSPEDEMTPFERALERVRQGAGIRIERPMPSKGYDRTLGGVSEI